MDIIGVWLDKILGTQPWYVALKKITLNAIVLAETTGNTGSDKRKAAIQGVLSALELMNIKIPLPNFILEFIISTLIDTIVYLLNKQFGKAWLEKIKEIIGNDAVAQ